MEGLLKDRIEQACCVGCLPPVHIPHFPFSLVAERAADQEAVSRHSQDPAAPEQEPAKAAGPDPAQGSAKTGGCVGCVVIHFAQGGVAPKHCANTV